ncbi:MAG TPA: serine/threonine-protein kinase, partial [Vicinamibacteria bacterium]|nr:serine/threonine-protein kinase [Vicinamibacteria bacterium]
MQCPSCGVANDEDVEACLACGRSLFFLTLGTLLGGRYEVQALLGRGGMGMVYKAHDRELDEVVALKLLRSDAARSPEMARRFRSEIKLARKVRHRNVCAIHEYGQDGHLQYIAMEYVEGHDLKTLLRRSGPFPAPEAFDAAIQAAEGLQAVHEVGIVHRDLKTPNIMRDARGLVRLMDFGIAKDFEGESSGGATATGQIVGTPEYMSPEQVKGEKLDARSDIYALGIVVFELFTGDVPFRGATVASTLMMQLQAPLPLEGPAARRLPEPLVGVLRRALEKDRAARFARSADMAGALAAARTESARVQPEAPLTAQGAGMSVAVGPTAVVAAAAPDLTEVPTPAPTPVPALDPTPVPRRLPPHPQPALRTVPARPDLAGSARP